MKTSYSCTKHPIKTPCAMTTLVGLALLVAASIARADMATLTDDSYITSNKPTAINGTKPSLLVIDQAQDAYLKFKLDNAQPLVAKATLKVFVSAIKTPGSVSVHDVASSWDELTLKTAYTPVPGSALTQSGMVTLNDKNEWLEFDVTAYLQSLVDASANEASFVLSGAVGLNMQLDSKEGVKTSHSPELNITWSILGLNTVPGTGTYNVAIGNGALSSNTTGSNNTANGFQALNHNTTGGYNVANGVWALNYNTTGISNTANGFSALSSNSTGSYNTANGYSALSANSTGSSNVANGEEVLMFNTSGRHNTAYGYLALYSNTTGIYNTADGDNTLYSNTSGSNNIAIGSNAGANLTTGSNNIDIANAGVAGEFNTIRIGNPVHTATYIAGALYSPSDRNLKENFTPIDAQNVLEKVGELPLLNWNYKNDAQHTKHLGPMAQDFYAAFGIGSDDKHISTVDEGGVALAAIQGLYQKLQEKDQEIYSLKSKTEELESKLHQMDMLEQELARVTNRSDSLEQELAVIKAKLGIN